MSDTETGSAPAPAPAPGGGGVQPLPDGSPDPLSLHEGLPVESGHKATLANFLYREADAPVPSPPAFATR